MQHFRTYSGRLITFHVMHYSDTDGLCNLCANVLNVADANWFRVGCRVGCLICCGHICTAHCLEGRAAIGCGEAIHECFNRSRVDE